MDNTKGISKLSDEDFKENPVGPLEIARENLELFADSFITQDSLRKMVDWYLVLGDVINDKDINEMERKQVREEIEYFEQAWTAIADLFYEKGVSA